mgnify:CR=1 FL=1
MKISTKRQVAIPQQIMNYLALKVGDEVNFEIEGTSVKVVPVKRITIRRDQAFFFGNTWQNEVGKSIKEYAKKSGKVYKNGKNLREEIENE